MEREYDEPNFRRVDVKKIECKDCVFREKDRAGGKIKGAILSVCSCFESKPEEILWGKDECPYYIGE